MTVPIRAAEHNVPPVTAETPESRLRRRRAERVRMALMVMGSYGIDAFLLWLLHLAGAVPAIAPVYYLLAGGVACTAIYLALRGGWSERFSDPYLTGVQMAAASALQLSAAYVAPEVGVLTLSMVFLVFAFSALRLTFRQVLPQWVLVTLGLALVIGWAPRPLSLPAATPWQAALSVIWLSLAIARCALVGLYGASVRQLLGTRNRQLAEARDALHHLASRDELTGALNRRAIMELLRHALQDDTRGQSTVVAVALLDLDHFKQINDRHGHLVGDEVLRRFVRVASGTLRGSDRVGRYGGEEFLVLVTEAPTHEVSQAIVERVRAAVEAEDWPGIAAGLAVTVSAGLAVHRDDEGIEALLQRADEALYEAKTKGRNRVVAR